GALIRQLCFREMGRMFTYQLSLREKHRLVTTGPYFVVRHPSYIGMLMVMVGTTLCVLAAPGTWWTEAGMMGTHSGKVMVGVWVSLWLVVLSLVSRAGKEDVMLRGEFRAEWEEYVDRVPYRMVPGLI
ncbi:hypothetical protein FA95DRAFT_1486551, partial [Auriscalpium vulgare]